MVSTWTIGKIQRVLGIVLLAGVAAAAVYPYYPFGRLFGFLMKFEFSSLAIVTILGVMLILEGLANISEV